MLSDFDKAILEKLQDGLPLVENPYEEISESLGVSEEELIKRIRELKDTGIIRRYGAILNHRTAGVTSNAMVVWIVPEDRIEDVGGKMASFQEVSHCYQRPTFDGWPFNLFAMVHGKSRSHCEEIINKISRTIEIYNYNILYSTQELKKTSMKYFSS